MASRTLQTGIPAITIRPGMILKLEAIDPVTGDPITGVGTASWAIFGLGDTPDDAPDAIASGPFMLVPGPGA